jgi:hypothetical protein
MQNSTDPIIAAYERRIELLRQYLDVSRRTEAALISRNLVELERCLDAELELIDELAALETLAGTRMAGEETRRMPELLTAIRTLAAEMSRLHHRKSAVIDKGTEFSTAMLKVICPPLTYESLGSHKAVVAALPAETKVSLQG